MRLCTMGLKEGFLNNLLFCLRERIYRQVLLDLCVVHVSFGNEFPENFSRPLMCVAATSKRRSNVKPQIIILTSLSRQTGIRLDSWGVPMSRATLRGPGTIIIPPVSTAITWLS